MRAGHIAAVELLDSGTDDDAAIRQSRAMFAARIRLGFDGFEVWDKTRRIYCYPPEDEVPPSGGGPSADDVRR